MQPLTSRRQFVAAGLALSGSLAIPDLGRTLFGKPLRILFLGGTGFIGPHMVRQAMYRGHAITLFNRGRTAP
ncbi:MAG: epimerase, partial [Gemmatimonadales bacterium]